MIHVIDENDRSGEVVKVEGNNIYVRWHDKKLTCEVLRKVDFYGDIQSGFFERLFNSGKNKYYAISFGNSLGV